MAAIGKGDWVQSLIDHQYESCVVRRDGVYCVDFFEPAGSPCDRCGDTTPGFILLGVGRPFVTRGQFCHCEFRPLGGSTKTRTLKSPPINASARESEDA